MKIFYNVYVICFFASIGGMLFGFDLASMTGVLGTVAYTDYFGVVGGTGQGAITCAMPIGSLFGALGSSFLADKYSRRTAIQASCVIWIVGSVLQAASTNIALLVVGRVIGGVAVGITSSVVPIYQSEIAPKEIRGRVVSLQQWAITWGILFGYFVQYGSSFAGGGPNDPQQSTAAFRIPWGFQTLPAAILFFGLFLFPRSPRWLASKDRWEQAIKVLSRLHASGDTNSPKVLAEYKEIEEALRFEREEQKSNIRTLISPRIRGRVLLGICIQMYSQLSGMNVMMYYVVYIMEAASIGNPLLTASIQYILNVVLTIPAIFFLDKFGRRRTMLIGSALMASWLIVVGILEGYYGKPNPDQSGPLGALTWIVGSEHPHICVAIVVCSYLFVCTFATTWGPASWTYPSEIFPHQVRAKAVSLATASNWTWNTALAFAVPPLLWTISWKMYMLFAAFNVVAFVHIFRFAHETKGKTLEEMNDVFNSGRKPWKKAPEGSRLDELSRRIAKGHIKVIVPTGIRGIIRTSHYGQTSFEPRDLPLQGSSSPEDISIELQELPPQDSSDNVRPLSNELPAPPPQRLSQYETWFGSLSDLPTRLPRRTR